MLGSLQHQTGQRFLNRIIQLCPTRRADGRQAWNGSSANPCIVSMSFRISTYRVKKCVCHELILYHPLRRALTLMTPVSDRRNRQRRTGARGKFRHRARIAQLDVSRVCTSLTCGIYIASLLGRDIQPGFDIRFPIYTVVTTATQNPSVNKSRVSPSKGTANSIAKKG